MYKEVLLTRFVPDTARHDGAGSIKDKRIAAAWGILPITDREDLDREFGTRHRAASGLSEVSDAVIIIVSEETGKISLAMNGKIIRNLQPEVLKKELKKRIKPINIKDNQFTMRVKQFTTKK